MNTLRAAAGTVLALALSGISVLCCYLFGTHLAPGQEGQVYGILGATADALKALLPLSIAAAIAAGHTARAAIAIFLFLLFSAYSFTSELGLYSLGRDAATSGTAAGKEQFLMLKAERQRVQDRLAALGQIRPSKTIAAELAGQRQNRFWGASGQCAAAVGDARTFCAGIAHLEGELAEAEEAETLRAKDEALAGKLVSLDFTAALKSADAQSESLARMTGFSASAIRDGLALMVALLIEAGSGFGLYVVLGAGRSPTVKQDDSRIILPQDETPAAELDRAPIVQPQDERPATGGALITLACSDGVAAPQVSEALPCPVRAFAKAALRHRDGREIPAGDLHAAFTAWAKAKGYDELSPAALGRRMSALKYERVKRGGAIYYPGLEVAPQVRGEAVLQKLPSDHLRNIS